SGVSGYTHQTVPVALHTVLSHPNDLATAIQVAIACGGDTDTVAAIVGGIVGAAVGRTGIDPRWLNRMVDWPLTVEWISSLAEQLGRVSESGVAESPLQLAAWQQFPRNLFLLAVVLAHGFRRLAPPW
ncbi:MAG: ADP-ribosylglycohydrolase family protein, partial [Planctomycetaceae bacterium]